MLIRVKEHKNRTVRYAKNQGDHRRKKIREPLDIGKKGLVIAECLKKKEASGSLYKCII